MCEIHTMIGNVQEAWIPKCSTQYLNCIGAKICGNIFQCAHACVGTDRAHRPVAGESETPGESRDVCSGVVALVCDVCMDPELSCEM